METAIRMLSRVSLHISKTSVVIAEVALVALMLLTVYAVVTRYIFRSPSIHALEVSQYLLLVIAWMATGWVLIEGRHVRMEALHTVLPRMLQRLANLLSALAVLTFSGVIIWAGSTNVMTALSRGYRSSSLLSFPMWIPYLMIPIGGVLLLLATLYLLTEPDRND